MAITSFNQQKKHGVISLVSIVLGIICFFIVFIEPTATSIAKIVGMQAGDYITWSLTALGIIISIIGIRKKSEKNLIPIISLVLSSSLFIFWIVFFLLIVTGIIDFAP